MLWVLNIALDKAGFVCFFLMLSSLGKFLADNILKYFSYFCQKTRFDISSKLSMETICMNCQIMFSGKNKKNIMTLSSDEFAKRVVKVKASLQIFFLCLHKNVCCGYS